MATAFPKSLLGDRIFGHPGVAGRQAFDIFARLHRYRCTERTCETAAPIGIGKNGDHRSPGLQYNTGQNRVGPGRMPKEGNVDAKIPRPCLLVDQNSNRTTGLELTQDRSQGRLFADGSVSEPLPKVFQLGFEQGIVQWTVNDAQALGECQASVEGRNFPRTEVRRQEKSAMCTLSDRIQVLPTLNLHLLQQLLRRDSLQPKGSKKRPPEMLTDANAQSATLVGAEIRIGQTEIKLDDLPAASGKSVKKTAKKRSNGLGQSRSTQPDRRASETVGRRLNTIPKLRSRRYTHQSASGSSDQSRCQSPSRLSMAVSTTHSFSNRSSLTASFAVVTTTAFN